MIKKLFAYDPSLARFETSNGMMTFSRVLIPYFLESLMLYSVGTINTLMLSFYSDAAVAAVGSATQITNMMLTILSVVSMGAGIVINHSLGAGNKKKASDAAFCSFVCVTFLSALVGLTLSFLSPQILHSMHLEGDVHSMATDYLTTVCFFAPIPALTTCINNVFRSYGRPRIAVGISLSMNLLTALMDYIVIFRPFETPLVGVKGMAIAYVLSETAALIAAIIALGIINLGLDLRHKNLATLKLSLDILKIGVPGGVGSVSYSLSQVVSTAIIAVLGTQAISAKIYVSNIVFYVYIFGMSVGGATALFVGWLSGAGEYERAFRLNIQSLKIAVTCAVSLSILMFIFGTPLLSLFTSDPVIIKTGKVLLFIDIFVEIGRAFNHIEENSLKGAGDVLFPMMAAILSCWIMSIFFSWVLGIKLGLGLVGCWIAFAMDELSRGSANVMRWYSRKWITKTVR